MDKNTTLESLVIKVLANPEDYNRIKKSLQLYMFSRHVYKDTTTVITEHFHLIPRIRYDYLFDLNAVDTRKLLSFIIEECVKENIALLYIAVSDVVDSFVGCWHYTEITEESETSTEIKFTKVKKKIEYITKKRITWENL